MEEEKFECKVPNCPHCAYDESEEIEDENDILNDINYYWLNNETGNFDKIVNKEEFNRLQLLESFVWSRCIEHYSENNVFGCDGRYEVDYLVKKVEEWKKERNG